MIQPAHSHRQLSMMEFDLVILVQQKDPKKMKIPMWLLSIRALSEKLIVTWTVVLEVLVQYGLSVETTHGFSAG